MNLHGYFATLVALYLFPTSVFAQELEPNIIDSETALADSMLQGAFPGSMSGRGGGFTSRFDPSFNPAMGVFFDGLANWSGATGSGVDNFDFRLVELSLASRIDPFGWAYLVAPFEDGDFSLEEAVLIMDQLPANMSLRVGKMLSDFGKWNTLHLHDKPFTFEDGVREEFFGGNLNMTGVELHQWTGWGDLPLRWSLGVASSFQGEGDFQSGVIDNRGWQEMAFNGRFTTQQDFGDNGSLQYGASFFHTPKGLVAQHDHNADSVIDHSFGLGQTTFALDFTLRDVDATTRTANTLSAEVWRNSREAADFSSDVISNHDANGLWGFYQHSFSPFWSSGVLASWWQDATNQQSAQWFSSAQAGAQRALFVTRNFSEFNRLRLQLTESIPTDGGPLWSLSLQWSVILGSHSHAMDW